MTRLIVRTTILLVFIFTAFTSCNNNNDSLLTEYNISYKMADVHVSDLVDSYELIQLDTTRMAVFDNPRKIIHADNKFFLLDNKSRMLIFSNEGSFLSLIHQQGRGPDEYVSLLDMYYDESSQEIVGCSRDKFFCFDLDGNFLRSSKPGFNYSNVHKTIYGNYLFDRRMPSDNEEYNYQLILTDPDFKIIDRRIKLPLLEGPGLSLYGQLYRSASNSGRDYHFSLFCDTIYTIVKDRIEPDIVFVYDKETFSISNGLDEVIYDNKYCHLLYNESSNHGFLTFLYNREAYVAVINNETNTSRVYKGHLNTSNMDDNYILIMASPALLKGFVDFNDPEHKKCKNIERLHEALASPENVSNLLIRLKLKDF